MPSISDYFKRDDEKRNAIPGNALSDDNIPMNFQHKNEKSKDRTFEGSTTKNMQVTLAGKSVKIGENEEGGFEEASDNLFILVKKYELGDVKRYVFWHKQLEVMINVSAENEKQAEKKVVQLAKRISPRLPEERMGEAPR